jgi:hypothetical protein
LPAAAAIPIEGWCPRCRDFRQFRVRAQIHRVELALQRRFDITQLIQDADSRLRIQALHGLHLGNLGSDPRRCVSIINIDFGNRRILPDCWQ